LIQFQWGLISDEIIRFYSIISLALRVYFFSQWANWYPVLRKTKIYVIEVEVEEESKFFLFMELKLTTESYRKHIRFWI
jgi:hypothetical protein